ncbi:hypothetical protein CR205_08630 [Alteribacter lacisalsi]|uniref:DUF92 domain-containing protein n=1 Tax=Alteribacter lacisalsi TaxID=2045244 RepID=A0A2W0HF54_9BACI|nr:DUF92 domain-containing protein [Alteribacter lacisalsi]PYZ98630.1 hypothetical protein CR205_08630 [Alteribacter lacisalsi]
MFVLALFFITSSALGKLLDSRLPKEQTAAKGNRRDWGQVLANGGWPASAGIFYILTSDPAWIVAFTAGFAGAASDTWASEFGRLSRSRPIDILRFERVKQGRSGAVSAAGTGGALAGTAVVSIGAWLFSGITGEEIDMFLFILAGAAGFCGQVIDTLAGGTVQSLYQCRVCKVKTEREFHCGCPVRHVRGFRWLDNDAVNHLCTLSSVLLGYGAAVMLM